MHVLLFLFAIVGLPSLLNPPPDEPMAITVDILPLSEMSNVKPSEPQPELKKPEPKKEEKQTKPQPPVKTSEAPPPPPPDKLSEKKEKEKEKKKEEKKPEDKKDDKKKKAKEDDLAAVLKAVRETAQKRKEEAAKGGEKQEKAVSSQYNENLPLSMSEKDAIRSQIARCWNVPAGAKDAQNLRVVLKIQLNQDGSLIKVDLAGESKDQYNSDSFFRAAADSAMRAVRQCTPLTNLPPEKYATWRDMELTFDPKEMLF